MEMRRTPSPRAMKTKGRTGRKFRTFDVELELLQPTKRPPVLPRLLAHSSRNVARKILNPPRLGDPACSAMCWTVQGTRCSKHYLLRVRSLGLCCIESKSTDEY